MVKKFCYCFFCQKKTHTHTHKQKQTKIGFINILFKRLQAIKIENKSIN